MTPLAAAQPAILPLDRNPSGWIVSARDEALRILLSLLICTAVLLAFYATDPRFAHWFVVPVALCGALIGADALAFWQGPLEFFDPVALIGILGLHFFFLAPLLHVSMDAWMAYVDHPPDWREWLGRMALLNLGGLVVYRVFRGNRIGSTRVLPRWKLAPSRWKIISVIALGATALLQMAVYARFGGISGYMQAYVDTEVNHINAFAGLGSLFAISESFPILSAFAIVAWLRSKGRTPSWVWLALLLAANFVAQLLFGGLRGSRSNTIWELFWVLGLIHYWLRPITRTAVVAFTLFLVSFMYLYGFYKAAGPDAVDALQNGDSFQELSSRTGRTFGGAILGDLGRSDVQSFALYRVSTPNFPYRYAWGQTYLGAACLLIPAWLWPDRPITKVRWTTEVEYGSTAYDPPRWQSSRVYGAAGEAILNFGPIAVPFVFVILALLVRFVRRCRARLATGDSRQLLLPLLVMFCFIFLVGDSDNDIFFLFKFGFIPSLVVLLASNRQVQLRETSFERNHLA